MKETQMPSAEVIKKSIQERQITRGEEGKELSVEEYKGELKNLSLEQIADKLNLLFVDNYSQHNIKDAIGELMEERYPALEGWKTFEGNNGYRDPWTRNKGDNQVSLDCTEHDGQFDWVGTSE